MLLGLCFHSLLPFKSPPPKKKDRTQKRRLRKIAAPALLPGTFGLTTHFTRWIQAIQKVELWLGKRLKATVTSQRITRGITSLSHDVVPEKRLRHAETLRSPLSPCVSCFKKLSEQNHSRDHVRQILVQTDTTVEICGFSVPCPLLPTTIFRPWSSVAPSSFCRRNQACRRIREHGREGPLAR